MIRWMSPAAALALVACSGAPEAPAEPQESKSPTSPEAAPSPTSREAAPAATEASSCPPLSATSQASPRTDHPALLDPAQANETAPDRYCVRFDTTKGPFMLEVVRDWAPHGADRFYNLVNIGFYDDVAFFRAVPGFVAQFGLHGQPEVNHRWRQARIPDDPVSRSNTRGKITFATSGPDSRTTQVFLNFTDRTANLDRMGFAPFGKVVEGIEVVDNLHTGYGDGPPRGRGPNQGTIQQRGNEYLRADFPQLDWVQAARVVTR